MKWIKRSLLALVLLAALACSLAIGGLLYTFHYISTPPIGDPERTLLSWPAAPGINAPTQQTWSIAARAHQHSPLNVDDFVSPPLYFGPWTRWWWPGNLVNTTELEREMQLFADVGLAGVEIQPFAITVSGTDLESPQWQQSGWDSPAYYQNVHTVLEAARRLNMEVDLNNGSGWPTGGPHVGLQDGLRQLLHSELIVSGPQRINVSLPAPSMPAATFGAGLLGMLGDIPMQTFVPEERQLVEVVAAKILDNKRTATTWDFLDQITLQPESIQVISDAVQGDDLIWDVPAGDWAITALWQLPGGELVSGGHAHPRPGYVVDHLDAERMRANQNYLFREETGLAPYFGNPLRGFFNDSLEFRQERHWARGHLQEFESRMGYDPRPWLGALIEPGKDQMPFHAANISTAPIYDLGEQGERFLEDWDMVTSDLFRERYFHTLQDWGNKRGLAHRLQAYGGPMDIIRAAGESDIPESEQLYAGGSEMFLKAVSSGGHIAGKPIISAESFIFIGRAFMTTPLKLKALADKAFAAGINQLVYHGTAYRVEDHAERGYPEQDGWYPWQLGMISTDYSENWSYWEHAGVINRYIARNQYLLRKGKPDVDVLVLYPGLGFPQGYGNSEEPFDQGRFEGEEPLATDDTAPAINRGAQRMRDIWAETRKLEQQGLTWEWVNEHALREASFANGVLRVGSLHARGLRLHAIDAIAPEAAQRIEALNIAGMPLQVTGTMPQRQHGLTQWQTGDEKVAKAFSNLQSTDRFLPGPTKFKNTQLKSLRRRLDNGDLLQFFSNPWSQPTTLELRSTMKYQQALWLDAWNGSIEAAPMQEEGSLKREIPAYGSIVLWLRAAAAELHTSSTRAIVKTTALSDWSLSVSEVTIQSGGSLPGDWLQIPQLQKSGGPGLYATSFEMPEDIALRVNQGHSFHFQAGSLFGAATVQLNGKDVGAALVPPYAVDITAAIQPGDNTLELSLTPARKNRLVEAIENNEPGWNSPDLLGTSARVSAGLMGPTQIIERVESLQQLQ